MTWDWGLFIFCFIAFGAAVGFLPAMYVWFNSKSNYFIKLLASIGIFVICGGFVSSVFCLEDMQERNLWNNGICSVCGSEMRFNNASRSKNVTHYYYVCDNCGHLIDVTQNFSN